MIGNLSIVDLSIYMTNFYLKKQKPTFSAEPIWIHTHIVDALQKKDADAASAAAKEHIEASLRFNLALFDSKSKVLS
jgi:DNA-binding FadR family transcriptional regulator